MGSLWRRFFTRKSADPRPGGGRPAGGASPRGRLGPVRFGVMLVLLAAVQSCGPHPAMQGVYVLGVMGVVRNTPSPTPFQPHSPARLLFPQIKIEINTPTATPEPTPTPAPLEWYDYPILPAVSDRAREVYALGLAMGNNPSAFSVIGDCEAIPARFFGVFDSAPPNYRLGEYAYLQATIDRFRGNFSRISRAAHDSFTTSSVLSPLWAHPNYCVAGETPLDCELRINRPSIAFLVVGTMDYLNPPRFEPQMRIILDTLIAHGTVPILYLKPSNWEGGWTINAIVARLAYEYRMPLWNLWRVVQPLPGHGLQADGMHLTWWYNYFDDPYAMTFGFPWRNLTGLQTLDTVWNGLTGSLPYDSSGAPDAPE
jgi:hypothetical protein